jgi:hypothetical protein
MNFYFQELHKDFIQIRQEKLSPGPYMVLVHAYNPSLERLRQ